MVILLRPSVRPVNTGLVAFLIKSCPRAKSCDVGKCGTVLGSSSYASNKSANQLHNVRVSVRPMTVRVFVRVCGLLVVLYGVQRLDWRPAMICHTYSASGSFDIFFLVSSRA
jgi:hypothetical protein